MPATLSYPGVYIEEIPSGVRTITGVATSITALIGRAQRGPTNKAITINSFSDFDRIFGGLWLDSTLGYAVRDFYQNGGSQAIIVRLFHGVAEADRKKAEDAAQAVADAATGTDAAAAASAARTKATTFANEPEKSAADTVAKAAEAEAAKIGATKDSVQNAAKAAVAATAAYSKAKLSFGNIKLEAAYEGSWGANLRAIVDLDNIPDSDSTLFNLTVIDSAPGGFSERFLNLSIDSGSSRRIDKILNTDSRLVSWDGTWPPSPLPDPSAIRAAIKAMNDAPTDTDKQDAVWVLTQDTITQAEKKYARAKAARESAQNNGHRQSKTGGTSS